MQPDIYIKIRFRTPSEGGRKTSITGDFYGCPMLIDDSAYDCRLLINNNTLLLGESYEVPVKFLNRDTCLSKIRIGKKITLWEGKVVADGEVIEFVKLVD